jgi:PilZ domain
MNACSAPSISPLPPPAVYLPGEPFETSTVNLEPLRERRREIRYPTYEEVQVSLLDVSGLELSGVLHDVSRSGFRVELTFPVKPGSRMKVSIHDSVVLYATARYCRGEMETFHIGASIDAMFRPGALLAARASGQHSAQSLEEVPGAANSDASGESHDLARAIIQHQKLFPCSRPDPITNRQSLADRTL